MLDTIFLYILNMSFTASAVIIAVLLSRLLLQKIPKLFSYALWSIVLFRLVCPFSFESALSLLPVRANPIPVNIGFAAVPELDTGISILNNSVNALLPTATPQGSINPLQGWIFLGRCLWLIGIAALLLYSVLSLRKLRRALLDAVPEHGNVYTSASLVSPFVLGLFRPKIYLPAGLTPSEKQYILLHEQTHIKRFDHIVKLVSFFVLCLHWFNPLVWAAFFFSGRDMELSCDEAVIRCLGSEVKQDYSSSLLTLATGKRIIGGTPLAFGEGDTKSRIQNVLHYKKPAFWVLAVSLLALAALSIGLMTNPIKSASSNASPHSAEELWAARTAYVGNNSAVSKLLSMLPLPQDLQHNHFQLHTSGNERGIEWVLDEAEHAAYSETELNQPALLLFALVDNLEDFDVTIQDPQGSETQLHYNRIWADNIVGGAVRDYAKSATALQDLMDRGDFSGQRDLRPMLMVDGVLYFDTNKKISAAIEDSAVLGKLRSSVAATKTPTENGQCNFDGIGASYAAYGDGMAVLFEHSDNWILFEKEATLSDDFPLPDFGTKFSKTIDREREHWYEAVSLHDVTRAQAEAYLDNLQTSGWAVIKEFHEDATVGGLYEKGIYGVSVQFAGDQLGIYFSEK